MLSDKVTKQIDEWLAKFPKDKPESSIMPALTAAQEDNGGYLSEALMDLVADYLNVPKIAVYEVASFYSMYDLSAVGRHKINVCTNISCQLRGCGKIVEHLKSKLNIGFNETTEDGKFTLKHVECLGACGGAPMMLVDKTYHENLTTEKVDEILEGLN